MNSQQAPHICASIVPIFSGLKLDELQKINALIRKKEYAKGNLLFSKGNPADYLYIVRHGKVKLYDMSVEGRQHIVRILDSGEFLGELAIFSQNHTYLLYAEALVDTGVCLIAKSDMRMLLLENPEISINLLNALTTRLAATDQSLGNMALKNIEQRLAAWLLTTAETLGVPAGNGLQLRLPLPRHEIANILGTSRETLSRKLTQLQAEGIIALNGHREIIICNINTLQELAAADF